MTKHWQTPVGELFGCSEFSQFVQASTGRHLLVSCLGAQNWVRLYRLALADTFWRAVWVLRVQSVCSTGRHLFVSCLGPQNPVSLWHWQTAVGEMFGCSESSHY